MTLFAAGGWSWSGKLASQWLDGIDMLDLPPSDHEIPSDFGLQLGSTWYLWGPSGATWVTGVRTPRSSAPEPEGCVLRKMLRIQSLAVLEAAGRVVFSSVDAVLGEQPVHFT